MTSPPLPPPRLSRRAAEADDLHLTQHPWPIVVLGDRHRWSQAHVTGAVTLV